jgi:hypothetical protein
MQSSWTQPVMNRFDSILRSLLRKRSSQNLTNPSFANAPIGNPERALTGPQMKTFGDDNVGINFHTCFLSGFISRLYSAYGSDEERKNWSSGVME